MSVSGRHLLAGTVTGIGEGLFLYPACKNCYSKLLESENGKSSLCRKCKCDYKPKDVYYRYCLHLIITDSTCLANVTAFGGTLDCFFGASGSLFYHSKVVKMKEKYGTLSEVMLLSAIEKTFVGQNLIFGFKLPRQPLSLRKRHNTNLTLKELCITPRGCAASQSCLPELIALQVLPQTHSSNTVTVCEILDNLVRDLEQKGLSYQDYLNSERNKFLEHHLQMLSAPSTAFSRDDLFKGKDVTLCSGSSMTMDETSIGLSCDSSLEQMYFEEMLTPIPKQEKSNEITFLGKKKDPSNICLTDQEAYSLKPCEGKCLPEEKIKKRCLDNSLDYSLSRKCKDMDEAVKMLYKSDEECMQSLDPGQCIGHQLSKNIQVLPSSSLLNPATVNTADQLGFKKQLKKHDLSPSSSACRNETQTPASANTLCGGCTPKFIKAAINSPAMICSPPEIFRGCDESSSPNSSPNFQGKNGPKIYFHPDSIPSAVNEIDFSDSFLSSKYDFTEQGSLSCVADDIKYPSPNMNPPTSEGLEGMDIGNTTAMNSDWKNLTVCNDKLDQLPESEVLDEFLQGLNSITTEGMLTNATNVNSVGHQQKGAHLIDVGQSTYMERKNSHNSLCDLIAFKSPAHSSKTDLLSNNELKAIKSKNVILCKQTAQKLVSPTSSCYSSSTGVEDACKFQKKEIYSNKNESFLLSPGYAQSISLNVTLRRSQRRHNSFKLTQNSTGSAKHLNQHFLSNGSNQSNVIDLPESEDLWQFLDHLTPKKSCSKLCDAKKISALKESQEELSVEKEDKPQMGCVVESENKPGKLLIQNIECHSEDLFSSPDFSTSLRSSSNCIQLCKETSEMCNHDTRLTHLERESVAETSCEIFNSPSNKVQHPPNPINVECATAKDHDVNPPEISAHLCLKPHVNDCHYADKLSPGDISKMISLSNQSATMLVASSAGINTRKCTSPCKLESGGAISPSLNKVLSESCNHPVDKHELSDSLDLFSSQEDNIGISNLNSANLNDHHLTDKENSFSKSYHSGNYIPEKIPELNLQQTPVVYKRLCQAKKSFYLYKKVLFTPDRQQTLHFNEFTIISHLPLLPKKLHLKSCLKKTFCQEKKISFPDDQSVAHSENMSNGFIVKDCCDNYIVTSKCQIDFPKRGADTYTSLVPNQIAKQDDRQEFPPGVDQDETSLDIFSQSQNFASPAIRYHSAGSPERNSNMQESLTPDLFSPMICQAQISLQDCFTPDLFSQSQSCINPVVKYSNQDCFTPNLCSPIVKSIQDCFTPDLFS